MSAPDARFLDVFPAWLATLAEDVTALSLEMENPALPGEARTVLAGAVNYLFKSLDLIPDGIENLGFMDDAFVIRAAVAAIDPEALASAGEGGDTLRRLAADAEVIRDFLGEDFERLARFVEGLGKLTVRGRSVEAIVSEPAVGAELSGEVRGWASQYVAPGFSHDERNLIKLKAFLHEKLPA